MPKIYPDRSFMPLIFSAASPSPGSRQSQGFKTDAPGAPKAAMTLTFVVFAYPDADNRARAPAAPRVEIDAGSGAFQEILPTAESGPRALQIAGGAVNYTYGPLGPAGAHRIRFTQDSGDFNGQDWSIRFTATDPAVTDDARVGLTFVVDPGDALLPWIAVPGQATLGGDGPASIDFAAASRALTLSGPASEAPQLEGGRAYRCAVPIGNYGPGDLSVTAIAPQGERNHLSAALSQPSLTIAPGCVAARAAEVTYAPPAEGGRSPSTGFAVASDDSLATAGGAAGHFNTIAFHGSSFPQGFLPVPNLLGLDRAQGETAIRAAGFLARTLAKTSRNAFGTCVEQKPVAGAHAPPRSKVRFYISDPGLVPDGFCLGDDQTGSGGPILPEDVP